MKALWLAVVVHSLFLITVVSVSARMVVDQTGVPMEIPENPERVISLAPSITEMVFFITG